MSTEYGDVVMTSCILRRNSASGYQVRGGAIDSRWSSLLMDGCVVEDTVATAMASVQGGVLHNKYSTDDYRGPLVMRGCILKSNVASSDMSLSVRRTASRGCDPSRRVLSRGVCAAACAVWRRPLLRRGHHRSEQLHV